MPYVFETEEQLEECCKLFWRSVYIQRNLPKLWKSVNVVRPIQIQTVSLLESE